MAVEFASKLQMTAQALGCVTQKELCARFHQANPDTQFQLANSYKWMQGRATPRAGAVFEDWARVLDIGKSGRFLADCSLEEFAEALAAHYQLGGETGDTDGSGAAPFSLTALLLGHFALYSLSWSKAASGVVLRGSLHIEAASDGTPAAHYEERVAGGGLSFSGPVRAAHRALHLTLNDATHQSSLFFSCHRPTPPANVLTGIIAGSAYHDPESRPMAGRFFAVRHLQKEGVLTDSNRYLEGGARELARDLESLGYRFGADLDIGAVCLDFLGPANSPDQLAVSLTDNESLSMAFDRPFMPRQSTNSIAPS